MNFHDLYRALPGQIESNVTNVVDPLSSLIRSSFMFLKQSQRTLLQSAVPRKRYFTFQEGTKFTRAVNTDLFMEEGEAIAGFRDILTDPFSDKYDSSSITRIVYSAAIVFCCANDLRSMNDQKTPGTYFEYLVRTLFTAHLGCAAKTRLPVMNMDEDCNLPTDLIFDLGPRKPKFHVPVKTSTRERIIQVWAHQRVVDGAYGVGRFLGLPVIMAETKLAARTQEVTEICLPHQWRLYQMFISQLWGVCYLDIPEKYEALNHVYPLISVKTVGDYLQKDGIIHNFLKER